MRPTALFIVGEPGAGKTTLARSFLGEEEFKLVTKPKWTVNTRLCLAGHYTGATFDGADTVAYNGVDAALTYWETELLDRRLVIFDGDRFSHEAAIRRINKSAHVLCVMFLGGETVAERRRARSKQNETWVKGRITKAVNFARFFATKEFLVVNAALSPQEIKNQVDLFLISHEVAPW